MGLRERYLAAMQAPPLLRVAPPIPAQHATQAALDATRCTANAQQGERLHGEGRATPGATIVQPAVGPDATSAQCALQPESLDLAAVAWSDADISAFLDRRARLLRWGWSEPEAAKLAERLVSRDREHDERVNCADCKHYHPGRCGNYRTAGLTVAEVGRDLATMLQRCAGFQPAKEKATTESLGEAAVVDAGEKSRAPGVPVTNPC